MCPLEVQDANRGVQCLVWYESEETCVKDLRNSSVECALDCGCSVLSGMIVRKLVLRTSEIPVLSVNLIVLARVSSSQLLHSLDTFFFWALHDVQSVEDV